MGMFDEYGDDETTPGLTLDENGKVVLKTPEAGPPVSGASTPVQYERLAADNTDIDKAKSDAESSRFGITLAQGIGQMFGANKNNDAFFDSLRDGADKRVAGAKSDKAQKLEDLLNRAKLQRQGVVDGRDDTDYKQKQDDRDPDSAKAVSTKAVMSKRLGVSPDAFSGLNFEDTLRVAKQLQDFKKAAARTSGSDSPYQQTTILMPDGTSAIAGFDKRTNAVTLSPLTNTGGTALRAYTPKYDATTATVIPSTPGAVASPVTMPDGSSLADTRTALGVQRAEGNEVGKARGKATVDVATATASGERAFGNLDRWKQLHAAAYAADDAGPVMGRVGGVANKLGLSRTEAGDALRAGLATEKNKLQHELYGSALTKTEADGLIAELPLDSQDPVLFASRIEEVRRKADKKIKEAEDTRTALGGQAVAQPATNSPPASVAPTADETALLPGLREKYPGKSDDVLLKALRKKK